MIINTISLHVLVITNYPPMENRAVDCNTIAGQYDSCYQVGDYSGIERQLVEFVADTHPGIILEVGCGTGHWVQTLTSRRYEVTGLEPAKAMLDVAGKKVPQATLIQGRAEALPFNEQTFDRVFCINAFHHFSDQRAFLTETYRVLRSGGGIMTMGLDPHTGLDSWWIYDYFPQVLEIDRKRYFPTSRIRQMMYEASFQECITVEAQHTPWQMPARTALYIGRLAKTCTSQLTVLTDDEYNQGISRLLKRLESIEAEGGSLIVSADLRLYATLGWVK